MSGWWSWRVLLSLVAGLSCLPLPTAGFAEETQPARPWKVASLEQLTKDIVLLHDKYLKADGLRRTELANDLQRLVQQRAAALKTVIPVDPATLLRIALPEDVSKTFPPEIQADLERPITREGVIEPINEPSRGASDYFPYRLRDRQGRVWRLSLVGELPAFVLGSTVKITGVQLGEELVFRSGDLSVVSRSGVDTQAPVVTVVTPRHGDVVSGTTTILMAASDNQRVAQVSVFKGRTLIESDDTEPYEITWDTRQEADGPHALTVKAHNVKRKTRQGAEGPQALTAQAFDTDLNVGVSQAITVTIDNTPPRASLKSPSPQAAVSGAVQLEADASDAIGLEAVKFLVDGLVIGVVVSAPHVLSWDTTTVSNGMHVLEVLAVDRAHNTATSPGVEVRVLNANRAPALDPIGPKAVQESVTLAFTVSAYDPDGAKDPSSFQAANLPPWANFDPTSRQFYGTPDFTEASQDEPMTIYEGVRFEVCDSQPLCTSEEITISVINVNRPPVMIPIGAQLVPEGQPFTLVPVVTDPDGDPLQCAAKNLPPWARFDEPTCTVSGSPGLEFASQVEPMKTQAIYFEACDPENRCASQAISLNVANVNRKPALGLIGDKSVDERKALTVDIQAGDPDQDRMRLTASPLPDGATFTDHRGGTGTFSWTPREDQGGSYPVRFAATDGPSEDAETVTITVRETTLTISGLIEDDVGDPFAGAMVELSKAGDRTRQVITDDKGVYRASDLPPGTYTVRPSARAGNLPTNRIVHFSPLSQQINVTDHDQQDVNFTALIPRR